MADKSNFHVGAYRQTPAEAFEFVLNATSLATSAALSQVCGVMPFDGVINSVKYTPNATQAGGVAANGRMLTLFNRATGAGTTALGTLLLTSGVAAGTLNDNIPSELTLTTPALLTIRAGAVLEWHSSFRTSGLEDPGGRVVVSYSKV